MISVAIFFAISSSWSISRFQWRDMFNFYHYFFYTMAIMTTQGESFGRRSHSKRLSYRLAGAGFCLFAVVMVNLYSSTLTSFITTRKMNSVPTSSIQVVEDGEIDYLMVNQGLGPEMILVFSINLPFIKTRKHIDFITYISYIYQGAKSGPLKKMGDVFRRKPENFVPTNEIGFLKVASGCCAFSGVSINKN